MSREPTTLRPGTRLGPYVVEALVARGGMGEVYRARDTRLGRAVAVKTLRVGLDANDERRLRFEREARALATFSHPRICTLLDVGHEGGVSYLVVEYLEGETLAERLARGPLAFDLVVRYGLEIAEALSAAHARGLVHRDLKPGNVMVTGAGVKLLDFGIARVVAPIESAAGATVSEGPVTEEGTILGTVGYMAPEQLEGRAVDHRADIFALGAVLYEMASGRRAFPGGSRAAVTAAVLREDPPPWDGAGTVPRQFNRLLRRCLAKAPADRWQDVRDVAVVLDWLGDSGVGPAVREPARRSRFRSGVAVLLVLGAVLAAAAGWYLASQTGPRPQEPTTFDVFPPPGMRWATAPTGQPFALSPDGNRLAVAVRDEGGRSELRVREFQTGDSRPLPGTDGALNPFWSPDGTEIGFFSRRGLKAIRLSDGAIRTLTTTQGTGTAAWSRRGAVVFADARPGLWQVAASGGTAAPLGALPGTTPWQGRVERPEFLDDGTRLLYSRVSVDPKTQGVWVASLAGGPPVRVVAARTIATQTRPRELLYAKEGQLVLHAFDPGGGALFGEARPVAPVPLEATRARFHARAGTLAVMKGVEPRERLAWLDRTGGMLRQYDVPGDFTHLSLSPDESAVLFRDSSNRAGLAVLDLGRGVASVASPGNMGVWAPDGSRFAYSQSSTGGLWVQRVAGGTPERLVNDGAGNADDWTPDGRYILVAATGFETGWDVRAVDAATGRITALVQTPANEFHAAVSPDGRWLAYASDAEGQFDVYVQPFPGPGARQRVSTDGGSQPQWRRDGRELFYKSETDRLMAVPVGPGPALRLGRPEALFTIPTRAERRSGNLFAPSADGRRFLASVSDLKGEWPITVTRHWQP